LTGATGYVGGRLLRVLQSAGHRVRCLARRPEFLDSAFQDVHTAYYLVHSMGSAGSFEEEDRRAAANFAQAASTAGVRRIIYLGGLGDSRLPLSPHLRSRHEVGQVLRGSGVQVIEFRASIVIGSGSLSYEMVRALVERLPVLITPKWVSTPAQPIAIADLLQYLVAALDIVAEGNPIFEIGGADVVSYGEIMQEYARQRELRRLMIRVPVLTPRLSSLWLGLVTPLYARVGQKLIDSISYPTVVRDDAALHAFSLRPLGFRAAIASALRNEDEEVAATRWSDALSAAGTPPDFGGTRFGSRLVDSRVVQVVAGPAAAFALIRRIGGATGWYYANWLWTLRGWLDLLSGGVGMRRGRRDPESLQVGDAVDCWRVDVFEPNHRLRLAAEMKLPGRAWLEFDVDGNTDGCSIRQTAIFEPLGLAGLAYWYGIYPLHQLLFSGMLRGIAAAAAGTRQACKRPA
jgi:uncharacterized protein YbjT (DUF2867 family)